ncbi:hypothetical protein MLD38_023348 [Melastoma candidum]|uniref:Uncharacterized protein n=1 Tax=Melastoma candidum TaxID=119954 RepID=A0ACB9QMD0_9MYRT|nr:hypothetical protein MLD38_023348 [Melastoma candidum]
MEIIRDVQLLMLGKLAFMKNIWEPSISFVTLQSPWNSSTGLINKVEAAGIPVIDLSYDYDLPSKIGNACQAWGFFQVINHGIPSNLRRTVKVLVKEFFDRPLEEKGKVKRDEDPILVPAWCEFEDRELRELTSQWAAGFPECRSVLEDYASAPELALGVGCHKDGGTLTVLFQDSVLGLQIQRRSDDEWISVRPVPDSYVINLGNGMQAWTNDKYWSAEHRVVVNTQREKFSIPLFFFPGHQVNVKPLDELTGEQNPPLYKEFSWGKFFVPRNHGHFKNLNFENIQIDHFRASDNEDGPYNNSQSFSLQRDSQEQTSLKTLLNSDIRLMGSLDSDFVLEPEHRPNLNSADEAEGVPLIDLSLSSAQTRETLLSEICRACRDWGFFHVVNHGIPSNVRDRAMELAKWFFEQESEEKTKVRKDEVSLMGYHDGEYTKNVRDWKEVFDFFLQDPTVLPASADFDDGEVMILANRWPLNSPEFRDVLERYAKEFENLAFRLLELISTSLGLPADRLNDYFKEHTSLIRLNYYPPCPQPELALGINRHKDSGALTILFQDAVGGLQVCRRSDGEWVSVRPVPDAYVVNLGNSMQVWSNDEYWSAEHRVVLNRERERFSIPFFFLPAINVPIKPLEELTSKEDPPKYREFNWGKFLVNRMLGDYQNLKVEDIQMDNFKVEP